MTARRIAPENTAGDSGEPVYPSRAMPAARHATPILAKNACDAVTSQAFWRSGWDSNPREVSLKLISSLLRNCDGGVRFGVVSVSPVPAESRLKSGFFARKALRDRLF